MVCPLKMHLGPVEGKTNNSHQATDLKCFPAETKFVTAVLYALDSTLSLPRLLLKKDRGILCCMSAKFCGWDTGATSLKPICNHERANHHCNLRSEIRLNMHIWFCAIGVESQKMSNSPRCSFRLSFTAQARIGKVCPSSRIHGILEPHPA